uniref:Uncharacterized protein n=1 Tax=Candidatus Kentrum sp. SD TaxID=2126332 RepID=A0A450Y631_9GAMM|nr:MAG: hypothetical protein BECKSD772F_GA0070984_100813 [Candidatus Kentron sp. SD]VFK42022.1 MAG: hypothetical protein BECKSD772E_GA0070983_101318 [Candidatus Kentron sp. SD]VFK78105.1 MAG: hypothetical protein BECKSD772D_GA0070982_100712 [Candidatus Kentron sp. SD]
MAWQPRSGGLTVVLVPDAEEESMRDFLLNMLLRKDVSGKKQLLPRVVLCHGSRGTDRQ